MTLFEEHVANAEAFETSKGEVTLPRALHAAFFAENGAYRDRTYALLDAAEIVNLPELIAQSGLEAKSLFLDTDDDTLSAVAPWFVKLEPDNAFSASVFQSGPQPWRVGNFTSPVLFHSSRGFEELYNHFRRFVMVETFQDTRAYLRFWNSEILHSLVAPLEIPTDLVSAFFDPAGVDLRAWYRSDETVWMSTRLNDHDYDKRSRILSTVDHQNLIAPLVERYSRGLQSELEKRLAKQGREFQPDRTSEISMRLARFVYAAAGQPGAPIKSAAQLAAIFFLVGPEAETAILRGPVMQNRDIPLVQRFDMVANSFMTAVKRINGQEVL